MKIKLNNFIRKVNWQNTVSGKVRKCNLCSLMFVLCLTLFVQTGCQHPSKYRREADRVAGDIIEEQTKKVLGRAQQFSIERPSDILRRRLLTGQRLAYAGPASLGTDQLEPIEHWPEEGYPKAQPRLDPVVMLAEPNAPLKLSLIEALQIGARNSFEYQTRKEDIFRAALELDLERNEFRNIFAGGSETLIETDTRGKRTVSGIEKSDTISVSRTLESGVALSSILAMDMVNLLTLNRASAFGILSDTTVSVPLLRGSGRHIVTEPLTQAERDVVYAIYQFERFKKTFAVNVAVEYLGVLRQFDTVNNNEENYGRAIVSGRWARRRADAGLLPEIEVDQALQRQLGSRNIWIRATETYKRRMDSFKNLLGLPPDARIELDRSQLQRLATYSDKFSTDSNEIQKSQSDNKAQPADAPVVLEPPDTENAGPLEIEQGLAMQLAFENRVDLRVVQGRVYDAQRAVVVLADALGAELTLFADAELGARRTIGSAGLKDAQLRTDKGRYSALLSLDLPFERTAERNAYRNSYIFLERAVRDVQILEDEIKISIRNKLRDLLESRETLLIQRKSVTLAEKRVKGTNLFLEAGMRQIRDLLEAQDSLLSAQNALTAAIVNYRIAELELQRDMGVLEIDEKGLWKEFSPEEFNNAER